MQRKLEEAATLEEKALQKRRQVLGNDHPQTLTSMVSLAMIYQKQGKLAEAVALEEEVLPNLKLIRGNQHPDTLWTMDNLASIYRIQGRTQEAATLQEVLGKIKAQKEGQTIVRQIPLRNL